MKRLLSDIDENINETRHPSKKKRMLSELDNNIKTPPN